MIAEAISAGFLGPRCQKRWSISRVSTGYIFTEGIMWHSQKEISRLDRHHRRQDPEVDALAWGTSVLMSPAGHPDGTFIDR